MTNNKFELIFTSAIIILSILVYFLFEFLIQNELKKKNTNRISKIKIRKTVTRRGKKINYQIPLVIGIDTFWVRFFAKLIDYFIYLCFFYLLDQIINNINIWLFAFLALFIVNPIFETLTGKTPGKFLLGMEVIDDFGKKPSIVTSIIKNVLQLFSLIFYVFSQGVIVEEEMFFHNKKTFTYTIWEKDKKKILSTLNNNVKNLNP